MHFQSCLKGFHDCVGGCNGCINYENPDNAGLQAITEVLDDLHSHLEFSTIASRADFYVLSAIVGIELGIENGDQDKYT
jgi:hypothetical protein